MFICCAYEVFVCVNSVLTPLTKHSLLLAVLCNTSCYHGNISTGTVCFLSLWTGPNWCQLVIDVLMCRRVCHLKLELSVAEWGEILSRVHQAEQLEEFSLGIDVSILYCM